MPNSVRDKVRKEIQDKLLIHMDTCDCLNCREGGRVDETVSSILSAR